MLCTPTFDPTFDLMFDPAFNPTFNPTFDLMFDLTFDPTFDLTIDFQRKISCQSGTPFSVSKKNLIAKRRSTPVISGKR